MPLVKTDMKWDIVIPVARDEAEEISEGPARILLQVTRVSKTKHNLRNRDKATKEEEKKN